MRECEPAYLPTELHPYPVSLRLSAIALSPVRATTGLFPQPTKAPALVLLTMAAVRRSLPMQAGHGLQSSRTLHRSSRASAVYPLHLDLCLEQQGGLPCQIPLWSPVHLLTEGSQQELLSPCDRQPEGGYCKSALQIGFRPADHRLGAERIFRFVLGAVCEVARKSHGFTS